MGKAYPKGPRGIGLRHKENIGLAAHLEVFKPYIYSHSSTQTVLLLPLFFRVRTLRPKKKIWAYSPKLVNGGRRIFICTV